MARVPPALQEPSGQLLAEEARLLLEARKEALDLGVCPPGASRVPHPRRGRVHAETPTRSEFVEDHAVEIRPDPVSAPRGEPAVDRGPGGAEHPALVAEPSRRARATSRCHPPAQGTRVPSRPAVRSRSMGCRASGRAGASSARSVPTGADELVADQAHGHVAAQQEGQPAEHPLFGEARSLAELRPDPLGVHEPAAARKTLLALDDTVRDLPVSAGQ